MRVVFLFAAVFLSIFTSQAGQHPGVVQKMGTGYPETGTHIDYLKDVFEALLRQVTSLESAKNTLNLVYENHETMHGKKRAKLNAWGEKIFQGVEEGNKIIAHVKVMAVLHSVILSYGRPAPDSELATLLSNVAGVLNTEFFAKPDGHRYLTVKNIPLYDAATGHFKETFEDPESHQQVPIPSAWYERERREYLTVVHGLKERIADLEMGSILEKFFKKIATDQEIIAHSLSLKSSYKNIKDGKKPTLFPELKTWQELTGHLRAMSVLNTVILTRLWPFCP